MIVVNLSLGYPFLQEALVTAVSDELFRYVPDENGQILPIPHSPFELGAWKRKADRIESQYSKRLAMVIGPVEVVIHVSHLKGLKRTDDGAMVKDYAIIPGTETDFAAQAIVSGVVSEDQRFMESEALDVTEEFTEGSRAFYLGDFNYGRPLAVLGHKDGKLIINVLTEKSKEPEFGHQIVAEAERLTPYIPSYQVARMLNLNPLVLSKITSGFSVMVDDERQNLGLNLKFEGKKLKVLGYTRKRNNGWEFSQNAISLLREYTQNFPEFFAALQRNPQGDIYQDTEFYPTETVKEKMAEIKQWLKSIQSKGFERVSLEAQQLDGDVVKRIEAAVDEWLAKGEEKIPKRLNNVPRRALLKPSDAEYRCADQKFALGDRVVYVQDSGKVPIGSRGTVVGLTQSPRRTLLDVVWDVTFMSGTTLGERCSPFRGMTVPLGSVLNLTNRQVIAASAASVSKQAAIKAANTPSSSFQNAPTPPPPLNRPFNAAHNGVPPHNHVHMANGRGGVVTQGRGGHVHQNSHANGRGGGTPQPINYNGMHSQNNFRGEAFTPQRPPTIMQRPSNQAPVAAAPVATIRVVGDDKPPGRVLPKDYQAVPPPANLNRGGGRGRRGGGRGSPRKGGRGVPAFT